MIIYHNISSMQAHREMKSKLDKTNKGSEKLSSGLRINRAADDAAGLAISEKMRAQIRGLNKASKNAQDGISLIQTAEGAMQEMQNMMQRMRELCVQKVNDTLTSADRDCIDRELIQLLEANDFITETTAFNTKTLLNGTFFNQYLQIGANTSQDLLLAIDDISNIALNLPSSVIMPLEPPIPEIDLNISIIDTALTKISNQRSNLGAVQNRLEHTINNLDNGAENLQASESKIRDVDMAKEMMEYTKNTILQQASESLLVQANQRPRMILDLLK